MALAAALVAVPAFGAGVSFDLQGTTDALVTRDIAVGIGGAMTDTVTDVNLQTGLSDTIDLDITGGDVEVFFYVGVESDSAGLMSFVADFNSSGPAGVTMSTFSFDTVFENVPTVGVAGPLPDERRIAGSLTGAALGQYSQTWTSAFAASAGLAGGALTDVGAGASALDDTDALHTFGIGQVGNDQTTGDTALGHFTVSVPGTPGTYTIEASSQSLLTYVDNPMFPGAGNPPDPSAIAEEGSLTGSSALTIIVAPEPASILLVLPAVAMLRRRR
jgi:hypothetical protein